MALLPTASRVFICVRVLYVSRYASAWPTTANINTPYQVTPKDAETNCLNLMKAIADDYASDKITKLDLKPTKKQALKELRKTIAKANYQIEASAQATLFSWVHVEMVVVGVTS